MSSLKKDLEELLNMKKPIRKNTKAAAKYDVLKMRIQDALKCECDACFGSGECRACGGNGVCGECDGDGEL